MILGVIDSSQEIVTNGLVYHVDASQLRSYPGSGTTWNDLSGNGNTSTLNGGTSFNSSNGGSIAFDGSTGFVDGGTGLSVQVNRTSGFTLSAWILVAVAGTFNNQIVMWRGTTSGFFSYGILTVASGFGGLTNALVFSTNGNNTFGGISNILTPNTWVNIGVTCVGTTGNNATIYTNGVNRGNPAVTFNNPPTNADIGATQSLFLGRKISFYDWFTQRIAISSIYNRALTDAEMLQNFNANRRRFNL